MKNHCPNHGVPMAPLKIKSDKLKVLVCPTPRCTIQISYPITDEGKALRQKRKKN